MILSYARVSTLDQAAENTTSIGEQERKNRALAQMRGVDPFDVVSYVDAGVSGSIALKDRPAGGKMLAEAREGDIICASKLDRLFRSASDALVTTELLAERKIKLILIDVGIEPVNDNGTAKLFFQMLAAFAEFERGRIAERMTDGRRCKKERKGHIGGTAPYGYKIVARGREARLEEIPEEQLVIEVAAEASRNGKRTFEVLKELTSRGYRARNGKEFKLQQVQRILERKMYESEEVV